MTADVNAESLGIGLARECLYRFFAAMVIDPRQAHVKHVMAAENREMAQAAADLIRGESYANTKPLELAGRCCDNLDLRPLLSSLLRLGEARLREYDRVFGLAIPREFPPFETEYCHSNDPFFRAQQMADIAGFYRAFGLATASGQPSRPDHLALELEFLAFLLMKKRLATASDSEIANPVEAASVIDDAFREFFEDHLHWWMPAFLAGMRQKSAGGFYSELSEVLAAFIESERHRLRIAPPRLSAYPIELAPEETSQACAACTSS